MNHYPIKRRGVPRRLAPNTDGIAWLEEQSWYDTKITFEQVEEAEGIKYLKTPGHATRDYNRPMFEIIPNEAFSGSGRSVTPCQCDRFDRSWACEIHPEISWDPVRRRWRRPCTGERETCDCDTCHERRQRAYERSGGYVCTGRDGLQPPAAIIEAYQRQMQELAERTRPLLSTPGIDISGLTAVPSELGPTREQWMERLLSTLPDTTIRLEGHFGTAPRRIVEIDCETEQGAGPLQIEVGADDGDTPTFP